LSNYPPKILSLATAVPQYVLKQKDVCSIAEKLFGNSFGDFNRYLPVYTNASIETRYSCVPLEWYLAPSSLEERNNLYLENALDLIIIASEKALIQARLDFSDIDGIVVVSNSGIATPSLDALLMERLHLRRDMQRLPIFGLGCAGGIIGLSRTAQLAQGAPENKYLYIVVELCGLNFLHSDKSKSNIIATALFGDGASAAIISCAGYGPIIRGWGEYTWPNSLDVMGWDVGNEGLKVVFSQNIPHIVRKDMRGIVDNFLSKKEIALDTLQGFLCHPGGAKVLDAIEEALSLEPDDLQYSRSIMRQYGNMSAATVMFVLEAALNDAHPGTYLMSTFGPGFTAALSLVEII
jgi:alkylresorcinol/alkylpyrone synthase